MAPMHTSNFPQASTPVFALVFVTENRKPETENRSTGPL